MNSDKVLEEISEFLTAYFPTNIVPKALQNNLRMIGVEDRTHLTERDLFLLLDRIEKVILLSYMGKDEARRRINALKKELSKVMIQDET